MAKATTGVQHLIAAKPRLGLRPEVVLPEVDRSRSTGEAGSDPIGDKNPPCGPLANGVSLAAYIKGRPDGE